jgi:hypothetical protein
MWSKAGIANRWEDVDLRFAHVSAPVYTLPWLDTRIRVVIWGVTLDKLFTWSPHIDQIMRMAAQKMGTLGPLLNCKSDLSVRNGVMPYKQLIRPMMDSACPAWSSSVRTHIRRLQVLEPG